MPFEAVVSIGVDVLKILHIFREISHAVTVIHCVVLSPICSP